MANRVSFPFTQAQAFSALISLIENGEAVYTNVTKNGDKETVKPNMETLVQFLNHKISQVEARADAPKKLTPTQIKNEGVKAAILKNMEAGERYSIPDMLEQFDCFDAGTRSQYVSSLLTQLKTAGKIVRSEEKGKAYFALA